MDHLPAESALEWQRLSQVASQVHPCMLGVTANYVVLPCGTVNSWQGFRFVRATCMAPGVRKSAQGSTVLLKLTEADWMFYTWSCRPIKVLQAQLFLDPTDATPILDCTSADTVLVMQVAVQGSDTQTVAELFAGGFHQGGYVLHSLGVPTSTQWGLEKDDDCIRMQCFMDPGRVIVESLEDFYSAPLSDTVPLMLHADFLHDWWLRIFAAKPTNTWAVSTPCQTWSSAGREAGLSAPAGRLLLRVADLAVVFGPTVILLEQVAGFQVHRDYKTVIQAFATSGYQVVWKATLDLNQLLPCYRKRHLLVLRRADVPLPAPDVFQWPAPVPSTLSTAQALFELPVDQFRLCLPEPEVLRQYLDTRLLPKHPLIPVGQDVSAYRIKTGDQAATCILAQYSFAHELPRELLLSKGLYGCLIKREDVVRFLSAAEIGSLHGAVLPLLCGGDRRPSMRLLGNCIATPHAALTLLHGCKALGCDAGVAPLQVQDACLRMRMHARNSIFLPLGRDWVLCHEGAAAAYLKSLDALHMSTHLPPPEALFYCLKLHTSLSTYTIWCSPSVSWRTALEVLGFPAAAISEASGRFTDDHVLQLQVPFCPQLPSTDDARLHVKQCGLTVTCSSDICCIVPAQSPLLFLQLTAIAVDSLPESCGPRQLAATSGQPVSSMPSLPPVLLLLPNLDCCQKCQPNPLAKVGRDCHLSQERREVA